MMLDGAEELIFEERTAATKTSVKSDEPEELEIVKCHMCDFSLRDSVANG